MNTDVSSIVTHARAVLPLASAQLGDEYFYQSLPLCVIDAVYSIGVRYEGVRNTINRYCTYFKLQSFRNSKCVLPHRYEQESVSSFCEKIEKYGLTAMAIDIFRNRQRTSPKNGILKSDGVNRFAAVLRQYGIEHLQDVDAVVQNEEFAKDILAIPGQKSGISLRYFFMLSGSDGLIKPDRMIISFLKAILGRSVSFAMAQEILVAATSELSATYPHLTPRLLDHEIWKYQRDHAKAQHGNQIKLCK